MITEASKHQQHLIQENHRSVCVYLRLKEKLYFCYLMLFYFWKKKNAIVKKYMSWY